MKLIATVVHLETVQVLQDDQGAFWELRIDHRDGRHTWGRTDDPRERSGFSYSQYFKTFGLTDRCPLPGPDAPTNHEMAEEADE